jgi:hypothetical protein
VKISIPLWTVKIMSGVFTLRIVGNQRWVQLKQIIATRLLTASIPTLFQLTNLQNKGLISADHSNKATHCFNTLLHTLITGR